MNTITGIEYIDRQLKNLEPKVSKKVLRQALRKALRPALTKARALAPKRTGQLKRSIKLRAAKSRRGVIRMTVSTSSTDNLYTGKSFYGGFVHDGATNRNKTKRAGNKFMKAARDATQQQVVDIARAEIIKGIDAIVRGT